MDSDSQKHEMVACSTFVSQLEYRHPERSVFASCGQTEREPRPSCHPTRPPFAYLQKYAGVEG